MSMRPVISFGLAKKCAHAHRSQHSLHWTKLEIICGLAQTLVLLSSIRMIRRLSFIRRFGVFFCSILSLSRTFQCWLLLMEFLFCLIRLPCYMAIEPWDNVRNDLDYKLDNSIKIGIQSMANDHCLIHSRSHHNTRNGPFIVCVCAHKCVYAVDLFVDRWYTSTSCIPNSFNSNFITRTRSVCERERKSVCVCAGGRACGFAFHDVLIKMNLIRQEFDILPFQFRTLSFISARFFLVVWQKAACKRKQVVYQYFEWLLLYCTEAHWKRYIIPYLICCSASFHRNLLILIYKWAFSMKCTKTSDYWFCWHLAVTWSARELKRQHSLSPSSSSSWLIRCHLFQLLSAYFQLSSTRTLTPHHLFIVPRDVLHHIFRSNADRRRGRVNCLECNHVNKTKTKFEQKQTSHRTDFVRLKQSETDERGKK